ncbi:MAG: hypothetical protein AAB737_03190, partial [Patescibacteria group bacterium]
MAQSITPNAGTGTIIVNALTIGDSSSSTVTFNNATVNGRAFDLNTNFTIGADGAFNASSSPSFTVAGNFSDNKTGGGGFSSASGTVTFDTIPTSTLTGTGDPAITFYNLTSTTASKTLKFISQQKFRINGKFTIAGTTASSLAIDSDSSVTAGVSWTQSTAAAQWAARSQHTSVVFNNQMWVIGGGTRNDVWYSTSGSSWTQSTANSQWAARQALTSLVFDSKMWVIGGTGAATYNDVWYSTTGATWIQS